MALEIKRIQLRRDTIADWTTANPILAEGEYGYETDTGYARIGDGVTSFLSLPARHPFLKADEDKLDAIYKVYDDDVALLASTEGPRGEDATWDAGLFRYREAASAATDYHLITAGGVKLYKIESREAALDLLERAASIQGRVKPTIKPRFEEVKRDILANDYYFVDPRALGYSAGSLVLTPIDPRDGTDAASRMIMLAPITAGKTFAVSVDVIVDSGTVTVDLIGANALDGTYTVLTAGLAPTGDTYSAGGAATGAYAYIGFRVSNSSSTSGVAVEVKNYSITDDAIEQLDASIIAFGHKSSMHCWDGSDYGSVGQSIGGGFIRSYGMLSGLHPKALWVDASGATIGSAGTALERDIVGSKEVPATLDAALEMSQAIVRSVTLISNSAFILRPKIVLYPGSYDESYAGNNAAIRGDRLLHADSWIIAPFGAANFTSGGDLAGVFDSTNTKTNSDLYLWGLHFDNTFEMPIKCFNRDTYALDCSTVSGNIATAGSGDGWDIDEGNLFAEDCAADDANNDGFNAHVFGHITLVDCTATGNADDGFSPHNDCTFEVWGGTYDGNGKGNVIPAFGAQGFCVGVTSQNSTGLSSRIVTRANGGFVALTTDVTLRPTVMLLVDCISISDTVGVVSDGRTAVVAMVGGSVTTPTVAHFGNSDWETTSGATGSPGSLDSIDVETTSRSYVTDDRNRVRQFSNNLF